MSEDLSRYWKTIVDTMMDGLIVVDTEGIIVSANRAVEELTGYKHRELIGKPCTILGCNLCLAYDSDGIRKKCELFNFGRVMRKRCEIRRRDGRVIHVLKNAVVLRDSKGKMIGGVETLTDLTDLVDKERTIAELKQMLSSDEGFHGIVGNSKVMREIYELISNAAQSDAPIIIYGESGSGKELVADAIHRLGRRRKGPFVKVSCAALSESLLESELFGHVKGAFTGASRDRKGRFEIAHKGDIFLDEIGDIPLSTQVKLLRVLQEKEIERVGDHRPIQIDVRIIAATHRNLAKMLRNGSFREDLYYRLNVIPIHLPPLRRRREDIPLLVEHFIRRLRLRTGRPIDGVSESALEAMMGYQWPGNVRELINVLEYAFVVCPRGLIEPEHLPPRLLGSDLIHTDYYPDRGDGERQRIIDALVKAKGRRTEAAKLLGISRVTLWKRLKQYKIELVPE